MSLNDFERGPWSHESESAFHRVRHKRETLALKALFEGWGERSESYDEIVIRIIIDVGCPAGGIEDNEYYLSLLQAAIRSDPSLIHQRFWNIRKQDAETMLLISEGGEHIDLEIFEDQNSIGGHGTEGIEDALATVGSSNRVGEDDVYISYPQDMAKRAHTYTMVNERIRFLFDLASMLGRPEIITEIRWENFDDHWEKTIDRFAKEAPYLYYDSKLHFYVLDEVALEAQTPVAKTRQDYSSDCPQTSLPPREYPNGKH